LIEEKEELVGSRLPPGSDFPIAAVFARPSMTQNDIGGEAKRPSEDQSSHRDPSLEEARALPRVEGSEKAQTQSPACIHKARIALPDLGEPEAEEECGVQKEALNPKIKNCTVHV
jgi:hypothetical protein